MGIYMENGYLNIDKILGYQVPFNFICGGRGTGKTFGALWHVLKTGRVFMYMRRTQAQIDMVNKPEFNPFKSVLNEYPDYVINVKSISQYNSAFTDQDGNIIGYTCALSTIANLRGFDASDVDLLIYDEFIPEKHERTMKNEGTAFLNAFETINRNRELDGHKPLQVICLANANNISNPIFTELGLVDNAIKLLENGNELYMNRKKGILLCLLSGSEISNRKKDTALYKLSGPNSTFNRMAIDNDFAYNDMDNIKSENLKSYNSICSVGSICIYRHKSKNLYYVSEHTKGSPEKFKTDEENLKRYLRKYGLRFNSAYLKDRFLFESGLTKALFELYTIK